MKYTINGMIIILCVLVPIPIIWLSCAWIIVARPEFGLYPLGAALVGTILVSILPRLEVEYKWH